MNDRDMERDGTTNRAEGKVDEVKGRTHDAIGGATGDTSEQLEGKGEALKGKAQQTVGNAQQNIADRDR